MAIPLKIMDNFTAMLENQNTPIKKKDGFSGERVCILPIDVKFSLQRNNLCKNLYLTDIGFYPKALYHNRERQGGCDQYILIYCTQGAGWYSVNQETHRVKANQFFILPRETGHKYGAEPKDP